ncbi:MAG: hypothetical protein JJT96_14315 [Opitutales bacterium]|nr:hypothetical protein [Opitutales bacterium]
MEKILPPSALDRTLLADITFNWIFKKMNTFRLTKDSEIPGFRDLGFWAKRKEIERLFHSDPVYRREQVKYGIPLGIWLGLSNSMIGWIAYGLTGWGLWFLPAIFLGVGTNTAVTIRLHRLFILNRQILSAYRRRTQSV